MSYDAWGSSAGVAWKECGNGKAGKKGERRQLPVWHGCYKAMPWQGSLPCLCVPTALHAYPMLA